MTDKSSTGSWVIDHNSVYTGLHRDSGALRGSGVVRLGRNPRDDLPAPEIRFSMRALVRARCPALQGR